MFRPSYLLVNLYKGNHLANAHMQFQIGTQKYGLEFRYGLKDHPVRIKQVLYIGDTILDQTRESILIPCRTTTVYLMALVEGETTSREPIASAEAICVPTDNFSKADGRAEALAQLVENLLLVGWSDKDLNRLAGAYLNRAKKPSKKDRRPKPSSKPISIDVLIGAAGEPETEQVFIGKRAQG
jgi:hypothetical protein